MDLHKLSRNPLTYIVLASPLLLYFISLLLPTFDDWTYFTTPFYPFGDNFTDRLLPRFSYWRPLDGMFSYMLTLDSGLFPTLNHVAVYTAHLCSTFMVRRLAGTLGFGTAARNVATIFFFISPAMLGTVLGIDSLNQAWSQFWGLAATLAYLEVRGKARLPLWLVCALLSTFSKENGITFFVIPQILAFAAGRVTLKRAAAHTALAAVVVAAYFTARTMLTNENVYINGAYFENTLTRKAKNIGVFVGMTWIPLDYVSLWHAPSRNAAAVALTAALAMPLILYLFFSRPKNMATRLFAGLVVCMLAAASPHLVTLFSAMHPYSSLGMAALTVAFLADRAGSLRTLTVLSAMFVTSCLYIDWHHWQKSYESGLTGKRMGQQALRKLGTPTDSIFSISIDRGETKYSSFCVIPRDAYGWGASLYAETGYKWPETLKDTLINEKDTAVIKTLADSALAEGYKKVLLVHGDTVDVIR